MNTVTSSAPPAPHMLTPTIILPVQFAHSPATSWLRRLYAAILSDALDCLEGKGPPSKQGSARDGAHRRNEAWAWVMSEAEHCFAFQTICAVLDLNVEAIRREVRQRFAPDRVPRPGFPRSLRQLQACSRDSESSLLPEGIPA
jgi:hypothetical protein